MVCRGFLSLAHSSETGHKRYIIKRESVCHVFSCGFLGSDGIVLAIRWANKYYSLAWFELVLTPL